MKRRKLRMGMIGGGRASFIGSVHRMAAALDGHCELVCGVFSGSPEHSTAEGAALYLPPDRIYGACEEMIRAEKELPDGARMDFLSIVVPNHLHFAIARMALENGFPVVCDKPMTFSLEEGRQLETIVNRTGLPFALTHNYTGYPLVKEARDMVREGKLGAIRKIVVEYPQGSLATRVEATGNKRAAWRTDPKRSGIANCMADIGTHAENLAEYVTGLKITELCADLTSFVEGRALDDDGSVLLRFENGARGILYASKISVGEDNALRIRIYGEKAGLEWEQQHPDILLFKGMSRPVEIHRAGTCYVSDPARYNSRLPAGHPEGFIEAFANIYRNFILSLQSRLEGRNPAPEHLDFPGVRDGVRGMAFIAAAVESAQSDRKWTKMKE
jgi:predicted dehydrogenase